MPAQKAQIPPTAFDPIKATEKIWLREKKTEQYHLSFGVKAFGENDDRFPALKVLGVILGGNMSARMFQNVREEKGLCYSIRTQVDEYSDTGLITTRAGVKLSDAARAIEAIRYEYDQIRESGISESELEKAKNYLIGKTDLATEDTEEVAHEFAKNQLLYSSTDDLEDWKQKILKVDKDTVNQLAQELFVPKNFRFAGIGSGLSEAEVGKFMV